MYGKLIDDNLEIAPNVIIDGDKTIYNPSAERLIKLGYKEVIENPYPEVDPDNPKYYEFHYEENEDKIIKVWDETEPPDNSAEIRLSLIAELKQKLADTDYISCKIAEGSATKEEYAAEIKQRQMWRKQINDLETNNMANYYMHQVENNDIIISEVPEKYSEDVKKMIIIKNGSAIWHPPQ